MNNMESPMNMKQLATKVFSNVVEVALVLLRYSAHAFAVAVGLHSINWRQAKWVFSKRSGDISKLSSLDCTSLIHGLRMLFKLI